MSESESMLKMPDYFLLKSNAAMVVEANQVNLYVLTRSILDCQGEDKACDKLCGVVGCGVRE